MNKRQLFILLSINLIIATGFFVKNLGVGYSQLSSDMHNIVPMCMKLDNPELYQNDLYLSDVNNFKFYTPFFIESLRFFAIFTDGNYVQATNILLFISHMCFGIFWFLLLYVTLNKKFWIALLLSILIRGIVWLPGAEIWGISSLWTMMPRTLYAAVMPLPFLFLLTQKRHFFFVAFFLVGLLFNFHPISGLGGVLIFITLIFYLWVFKCTQYTLKQLLLGGIFLLIGMLPFVLTYFGKTNVSVVYDLQEYQLAFNAKISRKFQEVDLVFQEWFKLKFLFFLIPLLVFLGYSFLRDQLYKKQATILLVITVLLLLLPAMSIYLERFINSFFDINLRMSFQLVRIQKLAILPSYFAMGYLLILLTQAYSNINKCIPLVIVVYLIILGLSHFSFFNNTLFISDDISRSIVPNVIEVFTPFQKRKTDLDKMAQYIKQNTSPNDVFYGSYALRSAAQRSVKYDIKGANILVEGNPEKLIEWYMSRKMLKNLDEAEAIAFLKESGVNYILSRKETFNSLPLLKQIGDQKLYLIP